ncbi:hypothetical protein V3851_10185 [Paenibacillus sp. M1]|uniref:ABC transporter permease n=1 Tax=Paenibacillus haidiansis TaxID=1574488 RepID=A0ABU7VSC2_9BACL
MHTWKDAWAIFMKDLRIDRLYLLWNVIFMVYMGVMLSIMFQPRVEENLLIHPTVDFLMLLLFPLIGFYFSRRSFNYFKEDSYTQMLLFYRTLPIPVSTIIKSRLIQLFTAILFNGLILFATIYFLSNVFDLKLSLEQYIAFALTWIGFSLAVNGVYIYLELTCKGRTYLWATFLIVIVSVLVSIVVSLYGGSLFKISLNLSRGYGLLSPLMWGALAGGLLILGLLSGATRRKLVRRDLIR